MVGVEVEAGRACERPGAEGVPEPNEVAFVGFRREEDDDLEGGPFVTVVVELELPEPGFPRSGFLGLATFLACTRLPVPPHAEETGKKPAIRPNTTRRGTQGTARVP